MIKGNIKENFESGAENLPEAVKNVLTYLKETDFSVLVNGRYSIDGERVFVNLFDYKTASQRERKAEIHKKFADVHFIISGKENIGFGESGKENEIVKSYDEKEDAELYGDIKNEKEILLEGGMFVVFLPGEIHRPGCDCGGEQPVRKAVAKISADLL